MADRYWVGGTANWDGTAGSKWATTSGGAGGAAVPSSSDDVFFDGNSGAVTVNVSGNVTCRHLNFSGFTGTFGPSAPAAVIVTVSGSMTLGSGMTMNYEGQFTFDSSSNETITSNGITLAAFAIILNGTGRWTLQDDLTVLRPATNSSLFDLRKGTFDANNHNVSIYSFNLGTSGVNDMTLVMGSGVWSLNGNGDVWTVFAFSNRITIDPGTSTIKFTANTTLTSRFSGASRRYYNFWNATTGTGGLQLIGSNTFNNFRINQGRTVRFNPSTTQTVASFTAVGTAGNEITLKSNTDGSAWNIITSAGAISCDYLSVRDSRASPENRFFAGANSTDVSGNTGWRFKALPVGYDSGFLPFMR